MLLCEKFRLLVSIGDGVGGKVGMEVGTSLGTGLGTVDGLGDTPPETKGEMFKYGKAEMNRLVHFSTNLRPENV